MAANALQTTRVLEDFTILMDSVLVILDELNDKDWSETRRELVIEGGLLETFDALTVANEAGTRTAGDAAVLTTEIQATLAAMKSYVNEFMVYERHITNKDWANAQVSLEALDTLNVSTRAVFTTTRADAGSTTQDGIGKTAVDSSLQHASSIVNQLFLIAEYRINKDYVNVNRVLVTLNSQVDLMKTANGNLINLT